MVMGQSPAFARRHRELLVAAAGALLPLVVAAALVPFRAHIANSNVALVLVVVVVAVATSGRRAAAAVAALSAGAWFDFFFTHPYGSFTITNHDDVVTTVLLLVVGLVVGELAARARRQRAAAEEGRGDVDRIYRVAAMVAAGSPRDAVLRAVEQDLTELLRLRACHFDSRPSHEHPARIEQDGSVVLGMVRWPAHQVGLPGDEVELPVQQRGRTLGRFVLVPTPREPVAQERRIVAVALADQVGAALGDGPPPWAGDRRRRSAASGGVRTAGLRT